MDPYKLLARSSRPRHTQNGGTSLPSTGGDRNPQLFANSSNATAATGNARKRKRATPTQASDAFDTIDFFQDSTAARKHSRKSQPDVVEDSEAAQDLEAVEQSITDQPDEELGEAECKAILREHKIKITLLESSGRHGRLRGKSGQSRKKDGVSGKKGDREHLYPQPLKAFDDLVPRYAMSKVLHRNIAAQGYKLPTEIQLASLPLLLRRSGSPPTIEADRSIPDDFNLLAIAPTGSGKTLAFVIPMIHDILRRRRESDEQAQQGPSVVVLAPTKELVGQIVNEIRKLTAGLPTRATQARKGMRFGGDQVPDDGEGVLSKQSAVKADIIVSTPGLLRSLLASPEDDKISTLPEVRNLVLDEADVLLDPLFRDQTLAVWDALHHPDLHVSLWSATMGSNIEDVTEATIRNRAVHLGIEVQAAAVPLVRLVVGLKDSAVPNVEHKLVYAATEQGKLMGLRQLLHPSSSKVDAGPPLRPPFLVFTQTIERAVALHSELLYDIPAEAGGISRIAVLHSDLSDTVRDGVMTRFRNGEIWVLITTDLLSRGVDFRGINGVVNYDIPTSSAAYVHRVGRTGRAGREGGVAVTLYSQEDIPYLRHVANVVAAAQKQGRTHGSNELQQWLLQALPTLSKNDKKKFKKRGIEARTTRGKDVDNKAARRARISTKSGYIRRMENNRKGAISHSREISQTAHNNEDDGAETDFGGFD